MPPVRLDALPLTHGYAGLGPEFATPERIRPLRGARLLHLSRAGCTRLGLEPGDIDPGRATAWFNGEEPLPGARPVATAYAGHQFGLWAGRLGDGRALLLGEVATPEGPLDLQLKGSGPTTFSRGGDGRAVWRSTLREYLGGEALAGLGVPTTRSLALLTSDEPVEREETEEGALLVRLSPCLVRIGTFEHFHAAGRTDLVRRLFGYSLGRWFGHLSGRGRRAELFLLEVTERNARLVAAWMAVGFCHGVLNTDNVSILGETLDLGPFAFVDELRADLVSNCTDVDGRYAFARQPEMMLWNLQRLAVCLAPLVPDARLEELHERVAERFAAAFGEEYGARMAARLGLRPDAPALLDLVRATLELLEGSGADWPGFWRALSREPLAAEQPPGLLELVPDREALLPWWRAYRIARELAPAGADEPSTRALMLGANPRFVARGHLLQRVIAADGDAARRTALEELLGVLERPFEEHPGRESLSRGPVGAERALQLSCSS
jgi:uncharacterized protein YdiU (UPF0061 family)